MKMKKVIAPLLLAMVAMNVAFADYAYSPVQIGVTTSKSFSVTLNGQSVTNSAAAFPGTATAVIWFNSTTGTTNNVNATVVGANDQVGAWPACATPIAVFKNTGNVVETLNIKLNNTVAGLVFMYNISFKSPSATGTLTTGITPFSTAGSDMITGLGLNNETNVCIWANFSSVGGGNYYTAFNYTSS